MTRYEMETILNFNEEEQAASIYTYNKALQHKLSKLALDRPGECKLVKTSPDRRAATYHIPKKWIKIAPPRIMSEAQREALTNARLSQRGAESAKKLKKTEAQYDAKREEL